MINGIIKIIRTKEALSLTGSLTSAFYGLANFMILARILTLEDFGRWQILFATAAFIEMIRFGVTEHATIKYLSGATADSRKSLIGANYKIGFLLTIIPALLVFISGLIFKESISRSGFDLFFAWYPLIALLGFPARNTSTLLQSEMRFGDLLILNLSQGTLFFLLLVVLYFGHYTVSVNTIALAEVILLALNSFACMVLKWDGFRFIRYATRESSRKILKFGKYASITLMGSNLLRSADSWLITLSPLGPAAVAVYSIPLKLMEILQIPLRSVSATAYPAMSKSHEEGDFLNIRYIFNSRIGFLTLAFVPAIVFAVIFPEFLIRILAGEEYILSAGNPVLVFQIMTIYGILLPFDKFTGVALDAMDKPNLNSLKVFIMVVANIIGDVIALWLFESLVGVALASIVFTIIGSVLGFYFLKKELDLKLYSIIPTGAKLLQYNIMSLFKKETQFDKKQ